MLCDDHSALQGSDVPEHHRHTQRVAAAARHVNDVFVDDGVTELVPRTVVPEDHMTLMQAAVAIGIDSEIGVRNLIACGRLESALVRGHPGTNYRRIVSTESVRREIDMRRNAVGLAQLRAESGLTYQSFARVLAQLDIGVHHVQFDAKQGRVKAWVTADDHRRFRELLGLRDGFLARA